MMESPKLIDGGISFDDRGSVSFANNFDFAGVKRFYMVQNYREGFIRAWHGHKKEGKYVFIPSGSALVAAVGIDDWDNPAKDAKVHKFVLSAGKPAVLYIPPNYANGFMTLTPDARLMFFSTSTLQESLEDDIRFNARYWDVWSVEER